METTENVLKDEQKPNAVNIVSKTQHKPTPEPKGTKGKRSRLKKKKELFADGTIIVVKDHLQDPENLDFFTFQLAKKNDSHFQQTHTTSQKYVRQEEALKIHVSDDEYEYVSYSDSEEQK